MHLYVLALADPVEAADALFQQVGIEGQVEQDQVVGELEVAPLAADLGTHQGLGTPGLVGEVGGRAVALQMDNPS